MRIVVVVKYYPPTERVSGIVGFLSVLLRQLSDQHDIHVVTHRSAGDPVATASIDGVTVHRVRGSFPIAAASKARSLDADVVVFVSGIFSLRLAAPYYGLFSTLLGRQSPRIFVQATHPNRAAGRLMAFALRDTRVILTTSSDIANSFRTTFGDRVGLLEPAIDLPPADAARVARAEHEEEALRIGFINHFNEVKGADIAMSAVRAALDEDPSVSAVFAGTGDLDETIRQTFAGHTRVEVRGFIDAAERLAVIASCDIMVLPFRQSVSVLGVSQTVLEVMAAGNVVLGTPTASITPAIVDDVNGVLVELDAIDDALMELIADRKRRVRLGSRASTDARSSWGVDQRAVEFAAFVRIAQQR